jgi:hypothetical protein
MGLVPSILHGPRESARHGIGLLPVEEEDHDQRFKTLIREFFADFMRLFFSTWTAGLDCDSPEWLEQEAFPDPPDGPRRMMDLVVRLAVRDPAAVGAGSMLALVHIEIESPESAAPFRRRMYRYNGNLRDKHDLPVLPIGVFLKVGLDGIGIDTYVETFGSLAVVTFQYLYVGLPALDALQYVQGDNWLGVALSALMRIPKERVAWLGAEALRRLTEADVSERQRFLLAECVQAYLPMDDAQGREFDRLVNAEPYAGVKAMNKTVYEQGIETGEVKARREMLRELAADLFGTLSPETIARIDSLPADRLRPLIKAVPRAKSLKDLGLADE